MRIFLVCLQSPRRYQISGYHFWHDYFAHGLVEAGHSVLESTGTDWARGMLNLAPDERTAWRSDVWERTLTDLRREQACGGVDLFLAYLYPNQIDTSALAAIRGLGIPCVNFFCDNLREFRHLPPEFAPFDLHWVPEQGALALYSAKRWPYLHAPMPCWVRPEWRTTPATERGIVSFVGSRDSLRGPLLEAVARAGIPLEIRGNGWIPSEAPSDLILHSAPHNSRLDDWTRFLRRHGWAATWRRATARLLPRPADEFNFEPFVRTFPPSDDYHQIVAESAVSLGINRHPTFLRPANQICTYSRLRDIEAPMLGACYLTEWTEGLDTLYEIGTEIETYRDASELVAKAEALLADSTRRHNLRVAAQRRALADHTVGRTIERLALKLGLAT